MLKVFFLVPVSYLVLILIFEFAIDILLNPNDYVFGVEFPWFIVDPSDILLVFP